MTDATESWSVDRAIRTGKALQEAGVVWIEDPVSHTDIAGMARVTAALDVPVATLYFNSADEKEWVFE